MLKYTDGPSLTGSDSQTYKHGQFWHAPKIKAPFPQSICTIKSQEAAMHNKKKKKKKKKNNLNTYYKATQQAFSSNMIAQWSIDLRGVGVVKWRYVSIMSDRISGAFDFLSASLT